MNKKIMTLVASALFMLSLVAVPATYSIASDEENVQTEQTAPAGDEAVQGENGTQDEGAMNGGEETVPAEEQGSGDE